MLGAPHAHANRNAAASQLLAAVNHPPWAGAHLPALRPCLEALACACRQGQGPSMASRTHACTHAGPLHCPAGVVTA